MIIRINTSIFCNPMSSFGVISGNLTVPIAPAVGDRISFLKPLHKVDVKAVRVFKTALNVESITLAPGVPGHIFCELEDVVVQSKEHAHQLVEYLQKGFDLYFDPTEY